MQTVILVLSLIIGRAALADVCADEYTKAAHGGSGFSINDAGKVEIKDRDHVKFIGDSHANPSKLEISGDVDVKTVTIKRAEHRILLITYASGKMGAQNYVREEKVFDGSTKCGKLLSAMDDNTRTKVDAVEAETKKSTVEPAH